jgi:crotonobetainyl-CoA:carnitine CoA-transferase CaiB-like acyl-CoA transferase
VVEFTDDNVGSALYHGHPIHLSESETEIRAGPPELGEHTEAVLRGKLEMGHDQIERLRDDDVID